MTAKVSEEDFEKDRLRKECGIWLKNRREAAGLSQRDLAKLAKFKLFTFVSQVECGRCRIPPEHYHDWAQALKIDVRELVATMLYYYEPTTYKIIFKNRPRPRP